jgi:Calcineurin-like phosphoesterase
MLLFLKITAKDKRSYLMPSTQRLSLLVMLTIPLFCYPMETDQTTALVEIPSLSAWEKRCHAGPLLSEMENLEKLFSNLSKEEWAKLWFSYCLRTRIATWHEIEEIARAFENYLQISTLAAPEHWVNSKNVPIDDLNQSNAYLSGTRVLAGKKYIFFGDRHGDARSLPTSLRSQGVLAEDWTIQDKDTDVVGLGDYMNNGLYSAEALMTAMILQIKNPNRVVLIRGNHENLKRDVAQKWTLAEFRNKFAESISERAEEKMSAVINLFEKLPVAFFIGCQTINSKKIKYLVATHASLDVGYNPKEFLAFLHEQPANRMSHHLILADQYNRRTANPITCALLQNALLQKNCPNIEAYLNVTRRSEPRSLGFCRDQIVNKNPNIPFQYFHDITTLAWGRPLLKMLMKYDWSTLDSRICWVIRGHQHAHQGDCQKDPELEYPMHQLWFYKGVAPAWDTTLNNAMKTKLGKWGFYTVQVAPDSLYGIPQNQVTGNEYALETYPGFNYDTLAEVTTSEQHWTLKRKNTAIFPQKPHPFTFDEVTVVLPQLLCETYT